MSTLEFTIEDSAYTVLLDTQPKLLRTVRDLLDKGETPRQIAKRVEGRDIFLAGLIEMAAAHMQKTGLRL
jgi:hypothetical protein